MSVKRGRPFKHALLSSPEGIDQLKFVAGSYRCERSLRNIAYQQNVFHVLKIMANHNDNTIKASALYWKEQMEKTMQGYRTFLYELGKIDDVGQICQILVESRELIQNSRLTIGELKAMVIAVRKGATW